MADRPAYPWRGLLVDLCRHWIGPAALHRTIDAMAAARLNVLHLHLSDDQAHRVALPSLPELHAVNPDGNHLDRRDVAELIAHGHERGVRIVPELDMPGHCTAWLVARPELCATAPPPTSVRNSLGIATVALDPDGSGTEAFLATLLDDVVALFDDPYVHLGGDEVDPRAWPGRDLRPTQDAFTDRVVAMVLARGRTPVVWDEAWHRGLDRRTVVQVWRGHARLRHASHAGWPVLLSTPYYLDLGYHPRHHRIDPRCRAADWNARRAELWDDPTLGIWAPLASGTEGAWELEVPDAPDDTEPVNVLGGEACSWSELCTEDLLDLRLWPVTVAIADVLWTGDAAPLDDDALAIRLDAFEQDLRAVGIDLEERRRARWLDLAGGDEELADAIAGLARCCEPTKWYSRHAALPDGRLDGAFDRFVDALGPRSPGIVDAAARAAARLVLARIPADAPARRAELRDVATAIATHRDGLADLEVVGEVLVVRAR